MTEIEISYHFCRLVEYTCGVHKLKMNKEGVGIELDGLNLVSKCTTRRADHFDSKFTIPDPDPALYLSIFQFVIPIGVFNKPVFSSFKH